MGDCPPIQRRHPRGIRESHSPSRRTTTRGTPRQPGNGRRGGRPNHLIPFGPPHSTQHRDQQPPRRRQRDTTSPHKKLRTQTKRSAKHNKPIARQRRQQNAVRQGPHVRQPDLRLSPKTLNCPSSNSPLPSTPSTLPLTRPSPALLVTKRGTSSTSQNRESIIIAKTKYCTSTPRTTAANPKPSVGSKSS